MNCGADLNSFTKKTNRCSSHSSKGGPRFLPWACVFIILTVTMTDAACRYNCDGIQKSTESNAVAFQLQLISL